MNINYIDKQISNLESKNADGFHTIYLLDYLDSSLIRYLINKYRKCGKIAPFIKENRKYSIKSLYIDYDELLDIYEFLQEIRKNQKAYNHSLSRLFRKIDYIVRLKG